MGKPIRVQVFDFLLGLLSRKNLDAMGLPAGAPSATVSATLPSGYSREKEEADQREKIVAFMRSQLGKGYKLGVEVQPGHEEETSTWDCSEETEAAYRKAGLHLPDGSPFQYDFCRPVTVPKAGDLGFLWSNAWSRIGHVFVFTGAGTVVHAVGGRGVVEDPATRWSTHERFRGWRRHPDFIQEGHA